MKFPYVMERKGLTSQPQKIYSQRLKDLFKI
jgi:hypothetical protein